MADFKPFTEEEERIVRAQYLEKAITHISKEINITPLRINKFLIKNNLSVPENVSKRYRFQKGRVTHNAKNNGDVSWRKGGTNEYYKYVRVSKSSWELEHHLIWKKVHGDIKKGYIICFIDGNQGNTNIDNLNMISRAESMFKNSNQDYPKEIIPTLVLLNELRTKLIDLENG